MLPLLQIAARSLVQHRRRSLLVGGAIATVTALLTVLLALSHGIRANLYATATTLLSGDVNVGGFFKLGPGQAAPVVTDAATVLALLRQQVPELDSVRLRGLGMATVSSDTASLPSDTQLVGVDLDAEPGLRTGLKLKAGALEKLRGPGTVLLFAEQARKLGVEPGDLVTLSALTARGVHNTVDVRVAAVAEDAGTLITGSRVLVPNRTLRELYRYRDGSAGVLQLSLKGPQTPEGLRAIRERVRQALTRAGYPLLDYEGGGWPAKKEWAESEPWTGQKLEVTVWSDELSLVTGALGALDALINVIGFVLLIVISAGLMNTLWLAIGERTREIGTLRSIGMQRGAVVRMFLIEGFLLGLLGTVGGALLGAGVCAALNAAHLPVPPAVQVVLGAGDALHFALDAGWLLRTVLVLTTCTTVISLFPSLRAARLKPVTAMHHIG